MSVYYIDMTAVIVIETIFIVIRDIYFGNSAAADFTFNSNCLYPNCHPSNICEQNEYCEPQSYPKNQATRV